MHYVFLKSLFHSYLHFICFVSLSSYSRSLSQGERTFNVLITNPLAFRLPSPFFSSPSKQNCLVLLLLNANDQSVEGDSELMAAVGEEKDG